MRRLVYLGLFAALMPWIVIGIVREATDDDTKGQYLVRAVFDNASTLVEGEDVKVAGVPVGIVDHMDVTEDNKAAVVLRIDNGDFTPFKEDAGCTIRLQGLIGERFVECEPGSAGAEQLAKIDAGDGKGERLLPVENTSSPVDLDLLNDIMRLPYRERLAILLNEFGTGLAGRGVQLNDVIHRANPALRETEDLVSTLARQNRVLVRLAENSDRALAPLARVRRRVSDFIVKANETGEASAERQADIRRGIHLLPQFLRELRPLMADLETFDEQGTPLLRNLGSAAPSLGRLIAAQGSLATAGSESFPSLGDALERGRPALIAADPLIKNLGRFAKDAKPVSQNLDALTASLDKTGGIERIMDFLYYVGLATNGFDSTGHYLRAGLVTNTCSNYTLEVSAGCNATFFDPSEAAAASGSLRSQNAPTPRRGSGGSVPPSGLLLQGLVGQGETPARARRRTRNLERLRERAGRPSQALRAEEPALDYLLGGDGT